MTLRAIDPHTPPPALLSLIQERFREMGVFIPRNLSDCFKIHHQDTKTTKVHQGEL